MTMYKESRQHKRHSSQSISEGAQVLVHFPPARLQCSFRGVTQVLEELFMLTPKDSLHNEFNGQQAGKNNFLVDERPGGYLADQKSSSQFEQSSLQSLASSPTVDPDFHVQSLGM
jgi:hypothetical protein